MSLQPRHNERGHQLGIGVVASSTYVPFNESNNIENDNEHWALSSLKKRDRMYFRDMRVLQEGNSRESHTSDLGIYNTDMEEVPYPVERQGFCNQVLRKLDKGDILKDVELRPNEELISLDNTAITSKFYVPSSLVSKIAKGEMSMTSDDGHRKQNRAIRVSSSHTRKDFKVIDPTRKRQIAVAELLPTVDARLDKEPTMLLITIKGPTESDLSIQTLALDKRTGLYEANSEPRVISLQSRIKHIEIPTLSKSLARYPNLFAVITNSKIHVIRLDRIHNNAIDLTEFTPLEFHELEQFPIVHVAFNPWNLMEIALIDSKGNWCIAKLESHKRKPCIIKLRRDASGSIFDPTETSPWNHIEWADDHTSLLVLNRSKLTMINFEQNWQHDIIQAKTWSELRDYKRISERLSLLLTSKEIILIKIQDQQINRLLSWKHDWDSRDPSIRISYKISEDDQFGQLIHVLLFSKLTLKVYGIMFGYKANSWAVVVSKPFLLSLGDIKSKDGLNSIEFPDTSNYTNDLDDGGDRGVSTDLVCITGFIGSDTVIQGFLSTTDSGNHIRLNLEYPSWDYRGDFLDKISKIFTESLPVAPISHQADNEYQMFQEYGYNLSEKLNELLDSWKNRSDKYDLNIESLASLKTFPSYFKNFTEFASLIEQLITYYKDHNLAFSDLPFTTKQLIGEGLTSWEGLFNRLVIAWDSISPNAEELSRTATQDMTLSLTVCQDQEGIKNSLETITNEISDNTKAVLDLWDNGSDETLSNMQSTRPPLFSASVSSQQFQVPTIKSSQQTSRKKKLPSSTSRGLHSLSVSQPTQFMSGNGLPGNMAPAFSLGANTRSTQPMPTLSQPEGQQRVKKKKKKKVGGFT